MSRLNVPRSLRSFVYPIVEPEVAFSSKTCRRRSGNPFFLLSLEKKRISETRTWTPFQASPARCLHRSHHPLLSRQRSSTRLDLPMSSCSLFRGRHQLWSCRLSIELIVVRAQAGEGLGTCLWSLLGRIAPEARKERKRNLDLRTLVDPSSASPLFLCSHHALF